MIMKKLFFTISFAIIHFIFIVEVNAQSGWRWQNPYPQGNGLNSIVMNGSIGWAVGDFGTVIHTSIEYKSRDVREACDCHVIPPSVVLITSPSLPEIHISLQSTRSSA